MTASLMASLLMRCKRRVPEAPSVPSLCSSHDGITHRFASLRRNGVCLWRRLSLRFARHMTTPRIASLFLRCKRRVPLASSVPSLRSSHDGVAHCFASLALHTACACGAVGRWPAPQPRSNLAVHARVHRGRLADSSRSDERAGRALREPNAVLQTNRSRSCRYNALVVRPSLGRRAGDERVASWPAPQPSPHHAVHARV